MTVNGSICASYPGARDYWVAGSGCWRGFILCQVKWHFRRISWHRAKNRAKKTIKIRAEEENDVTPLYEAEAIR